MPDTNTHPELPPPACIVTNVGNDKPQSFMLALVHGVALANQPAGSTLSLFTAEQVRAAILADRSRTLQSIEAKTADRDAVTVNLMRLFRLDKREARATADFIQGRVDQDARDALQAGMTNDELLHAWKEKLPRVVPSDEQLTAFALGAEVGLSRAATKEARTPTDYALEHAEYMAKAGDRLLEAIHERDALLVRREESDDVPEDDIYDAAQTVGSRMASLRHCTYEFRKRRDRAAMDAVKEPR